MAPGSNNELYFFFSLCSEFSEFISSSHERDAATPQISRLAISGFVPEVISLFQRSCTLIFLFSITKEWDRMTRVPDINATRLPWSSAEKKKQTGKPFEGARSMPSSSSGDKKTNLDAAAAVEEEEEELIRDGVLMNAVDEAWVSAAERGGDNDQLRRLVGLITFLSWD